MRLSCALLGVALLAPVAARGEGLRSPWDGRRVVVTEGAYACPAAPVFAETLTASGYYADKNYSVIDPAKLAAFNAATEGPTHLGQYVTRAADAYLERGSRAAAVCAYGLLEAAARADAWDGGMDQNNSVYLQNWMLSGTAMAYLKLRSSHLATAAQDAEIQRWFHVLAGRVRAYFDRQKADPRSDAWNNHLYWAGLAVAAEGIAVEDRGDFLWGLETYRTGVGAIRPDGSLAAEMDRKGMAAHYHLYALGPLVMLAELGAANRIEMYSSHGGAIHRLVNFSIASLEDPAPLEKRAGARQVLPEQPTGLEIGWAVPYVARFPSARISALLARAQWTSFWQWGGAPPDGAGAL